MISHYRQGRIWDLFLGGVLTFGGGVKNFFYQHFVMHLKGINCENVPYIRKINFH